MSDPQQQSQSRNNKRVVKGLVAVFAATPPILGYARIVRVGDLLATLSPAPTSPTIAWLTRLTAGGNIPEALLLDFNVGPARRLEENMANAWLALYLVAAASRLADAEQEEGSAEDQLRTAAKAEERYFEQHLMAEERRLRSASLQDSAAEHLADRETPETKGLLGWRALLDANTTPECRWAHGKNFKATRMPIIGWPGAVHMRCRCTPGPPVPGAPLIPSA